VSFAVPAGTTAALVGPSGAGKSTIAHLIARFADVATGAVMVGGVDVRMLAPEALNRHVAFVFQEVVLLRESVRENIRLARRGASDAEVVAAAEAAQAHAFISRLPDGYDTVLGEGGGGLSGGERQRLSIARAILADTPIVVLDEAAAFADPTSEAAINRALARLLRGKTVLIIAHRLSAIVNVDQILVLERGRLVARGRHATVLQDSPVYRRLWDNHRAARGWRLGRAGAPPRSVDA